MLALVTQVVQPSMNVTPVMEDVMLRAPVLLFQGA